MASRLELHEELCKVLGNRNVYYQPPESFKLNYPCIIYERRSPYTTHSNDKIYYFYRSYDLTLIDKDPDSNLVEKLLLHFPMCSHSRHFTSDNLNHDVFTLYY